MDAAGVNVAMAGHYPTLPTLPHHADAARPLVWRPHFVVPVSRGHKPVPRTKTRMVPVFYPAHHLLVARRFVVTELTTASWLSLWVLFWFGSSMAFLSWRKWRINGHGYHGIPISFGLSICIILIRSFCLPRSTLIFLILLHYYIVFLISLFTIST